MGSEFSEISTGGLLTTAAVISSFPHSKKGMCTFDVPPPFHQQRRHEIKGHPDKE